MKVRYDINLLIKCLKDRCRGVTQFLYFSFLTLNRLLYEIALRDYLYFYDNNYQSLAPYLKCIIYYNIIFII